MMARILFLLVVWFLAAVNTAEAQKRALVSELNAFIKKYPRTKTVLFLSQTKATPGDTIRFHASVFDQSGSEYTQRQILNLELADHNGRIVHRQNVLMASGSADSYLSIPAGLSEGFYLIRAFTNRMRNFGEDSFTWQTIEVVRDRSLQRSVSPPFISIHPEGGLLIGGVMNHLAVSYHGVPLGGVIKIIGSVSGELGIAFAASSGISSLMVRPKAGESIHAAHASDIKSAAIISNTGGVALFLREKQGNLRLNFLPRSFSAKDLNVVLLGRGEAKELQLRKDYADSLIYELPSGALNGYYQILIFSQDRKIIASRIWSTTVNQPLVTLELKNVSPALREKSEFLLQLSDRSGKPLKGTFNFTVTDERAFHGSKYDDHVSLLKRYQGTDPDGWNRKSDQNDLEEITVQEQWIPENWSDPSYNFIHQSQSTLRFSGQLKRSDGLPFTDSTSVMLFLQKR